MRRGLAVVGEGGDWGLASAGVIADPTVWIDDNANANHLSGWSCRLVVRTSRAGRVQCGA